jgi:chloramphenicol 3-O phosphotransferase
MLLNGSPSAGKSTLATAIQGMATRPIFHRSLDHFLAGYPLHWRQEDTSLFGKVMTGYLYSLAALVRAGCDVVAEAVITPDRVPLYRDALQETSVLLVGVRCDLHVAQAREVARTDRIQLELDVPWFETVHEVPYDAEVDTTDDPATQTLAARALDLFEHPPEQRAFTRLLANP